MRNLTIKKVMNGFSVKVGCQDVVFRSKKKLLNELSRYIDDPDGVEKEYIKKYNKETQGVKVELDNE